MGLVMSERKLDQMVEVIDRACVVCKSVVFFCCEFVTYLLVFK